MHLVPDPGNAGVGSTRLIINGFVSRMVFFIMREFFHCRACMYAERGLYDKQNKQFSNAPDSAV